MLETAGLTSQRPFQVKKHDVEAQIQEWKAIREIE